MKNVTISMDDATLRKVRLEAGRSGLSVSRWIARELDRSLRRDDEKAAASARIVRFLDAFAGLPLSQDGKINLDRDEMYGRLLRRFDNAAVPPGPHRTGQATEIRGVAEGPARERPADDELSGSR